MASKPLRPCSAPGCNRLARGRYCDEHKHLANEAKQRRASSSWHWLYYMADWTQRLRPQQLMREPFCRECRKRGVRTRATEVDHVIPHKGDMTLFFDPANLQSLCHSCHSAKTMREINAEKSKKF